MRWVKRGIALIAILIGLGIGLIYALLPPSMPEARIAYIERLIDRGTQRGYWPGVAWGLIENGQITTLRAGGWADIEARRPMTPDTVMPIGSVSKVLVGLAAAQAVEEGRLDPDAPLADYLSVPVAWPDDTPRTLSHLLTHTSGLLDTDAGYEDVGYHYGDTRHPVALRDFLSRYLTLGGDLYDTTENFAAPGAYAYSNVGAGLAAQAIQDALGRDFADISAAQTRAMGLTGFWGPTRAPGAQNATLYDRTADGALEPLPPYGLATWPDGQFNASARDLARLLQVVIRQGDGTIDPAVVTRLTTPLATGIDGMDSPSDAVGYFWSRETIDALLFSLTVEGHNGGDPGVLTMMYRHPGTDDGFVVMMNGVPGSTWQLIQGIRLLRAISAI